MASLKVYYDAEGKTLTVWFGDPSQEHVAEETGDELGEFAGTSPPRNRGVIYSYQRRTIAVCQRRTGRWASR